MKKEGKTELHMSKWICNGKIRDSFSAVVATKEVDAAKKMYEQMGYKVIRL